MQPVTPFRCLWLVGGLAIVLGLFRDSVVGPGARVLRTDANRPWAQGGFQAGRAYPSTTPGELPPRVATVGSWIESDEWVGDAATEWLALSTRDLRVCVAGYPQHQGCGLWVEFRGIDGRITRQACSISDPRETWCPWDFQAPAGTVELRIFAEDHAKDAGGWLAFSEPMVRPAQAVGSVYLGAQVLTTLALTIVLVWAPGCLWIRRGQGTENRVFSLFAVGPLILVAMGILIWASGNVLGGGRLGIILCVLDWAAVGVPLWRSNNGLSILTPGLSRALLLSVLLALAGVAKASFSGGPEGELYGGSIYRTLAVGDRSDSRISFHIVQAAAHHFAPTAPETEGYFAPWTFFSRGPLAGLAAVPVVLGTGGTPPADIEMRAWRPYDSTGFAAYRIVLIVLGSMLVVALFFALVPCVGETWAIVGAGLLALSPFGVHETIFTWPKAVATAWILVSFGQAHASRTFRAGMALGVGYLFHPMAALWAPWIALWVLTRSGRSRWAWIRAGAVFTVALCTCVVPWMLAGNLAPHQPDSWRAGQLGFVDYLSLAEYEQQPSGARWLQTRWMNFANTFLPFWLHLFNRDHPVLNSVYGASDPLVKFGFGWWNTLPLGAGLLLWGAATVAIAATIKRLWAPVSIFAVGPAVLLVAYWGGSSTGLMRECGHPLLAALVGLAVVAAAARKDARWARLLGHPFLPWLQLPETLLMLWLTTCINRWQPGASYDRLNVFYAILSTLSLAAMAVILSRSRSQGRALGARVERTP